MYYLLKNYTKDYDKQMIWGGVANISQIFHIGKKIEDPSLYIEFTIDWHPELSQEGYLTDNMRLGGLPSLCMTKKAVGIFLDEADKDIQVFNLNILDKENGKVYKDYQLINIVGLYDAVDYDLSDVKYSRGGRLMRYKKLILDESKIPEGVKIFRLEKYKSIVVIHETIKKTIEDFKLTGFVIESDDK